jgi:hypothetical protein
MANKKPPMGLMHTETRMLHTAGTPQSEDKMVSPSTSITVTGQTPPVDTVTSPNNGTLSLQGDGPQPSSGGDGDGHWSGH